MTSRIKEFQNTSEGMRSDISFIIDDKPTQVDVYRRPTTGTKPGFSDEVGSYLYSHKLVCRLDLVAGDNYRKISSENVKGNEYDYVGSTFDTDVRLNDKWKYIDKWFLVVAINEENDSYVEVKLKRLKNEA